jgi:hypothetical protein
MLREHTAGDVVAIEVVVVVDLGGGNAYSGIGLINAPAKALYTL